VLDYSAVVRDQGGWGFWSVCKVIGMQVCVTERLKLGFMCVMNGTKLVSL
jgi:hypothetical protein